MISVLVSCLYSRLDNVDNVIKQRQSNVEYIVVVQGTTEDLLIEYKRAHTWTKRSDVQIVFDSNLGVSYSRNMAISYSNEGLILFTDDDVILSPDLFDLLENSFSKSPDCTFITFDVEDNEGKLLKPPLCKNYHNLRSILGVGTIQIAVSLNNDTKKYRFPCDLGAGAKYPNCDEPVYLAQFLNNGGKGKHIHNTICQHPRESSGNSLNSYVKIMSRFIAFRYIFGNTKGIIIFICFILKT